MDPMEPKKRKSRTKNTEALNERKFTCECGKRYLSYSALYTHSKQKHGLIISTKNIESLGKEGENLQEEEGEVQQSSKLKVLRNLKSTNLAEIEKDKFVNVEKIVILFLLEKKNSHPADYEYMTDALSWLMDFVNKNPQILEDYKYTSSYCETRSAQYLPLAFNHFVHEQGPERWENYEPDRLKSFLHQFSSWLFQEQFTKFKVQLV